MFSLNIEFIIYILFRWHRQLYLSGLLFHGVYASRHALSLTAPFVFFQVLILPCNSCIQSSGLTGMIIIIPFSLLERRGRRHSNKSSNSLLFNHIANFSYLFFRTLWLRTNLIRVIFRFSFWVNLFFREVCMEDFSGGLILKISE